MLLPQARLLLELSVLGALFKLIAMEIHVLGVICSNTEHMYIALCVFLSY